MNRPNKEELHNDESDLVTYHQLVNYCDGLEECYNALSERYNALNERCEALEKALDKACELLSLSMPYLPINNLPKDIDCFNGGHLKNKEEWIATCLNDDETLNDSWKPKVFRKSGY